MQPKARTGVPCGFALHPHGRQSGTSMTSGPRSGDQTDPCTLIIPPSGTESGGRHGACLVVIRGDRLGARVDLENCPIVIGRGVDTDFQIASRSVSRSHCRVFQRDGHYWVEDLRSTNQTFVNEERIERCELKDGDQLRVGRSVLKFLDAGNLEAGYLAEMREHAVRDELTGLYNRRYLMDLLAEEVNRAQSQPGRALILVMVDIDHFKEINDLIGHLAGDAVLRQLSKVMSDRVRGGDTLGRIGGEEFAMIMPETTLAHARDVCERLRTAVCAQAYEIEGGRKIDVSVSMGLAGWQADMDAMSDLLRAADQCLYRAKSSGRNRVCASDETR
jgi:two-component system, cell cycle response regulator